MSTDIETTKAEVAPMTLDALVWEVRTITDDFIEAAQAARATLIERLQTLNDDPALKALEACEANMVEAVLKAEWARIAEAMDE